MHQIQGTSSARDHLAWLIAIGADECVGDTPVDRTQLPPPQTTVTAPQAEAPQAAVGMSQMQNPLVSPPAPPAQAAPKTKAQTKALGSLESARKAAAAAQNLEDLKAALAAFDGSSLKKTASNMVFGSGNPNAPVMLIGEAPGSAEDRSGEAFVGPSGQLLNKMLDAISLSRAEDVYISNILPWRPPGNRKPTTEEMAMFLPFIARHIELAAPRVIMLLGGTATSALLGISQGISRVQGRWFSYHAAGLNRDIPALATFHPAFLLRSPAQKKLAWRSLLALRARLDEDA